MLKNLASPIVKLPVEFAAGHGERMASGWQPRDTWLFCWNLRSQRRLL